MASDTALPIPETLPPVDLTPPAPPMSQADLAGKVQKARDAGYSPDEIVGYLGNDHGWGGRVQAAMKAGYAPDEILDYLAPKPTFIGRLENAAKDVGAGARDVARGAITGTGQMVSGAGEAAQGAVRQNTANVLPYFDQIDKGQMPKDWDQLPQVMQGQLGNYMSANPQQRQELRQQYAKDAADASKPQAIERAGQAITGYGQSLPEPTTATGKTMENLGSFAPYVASAVAGPLGPILGGMAQGYDSQFNDAKSKGASDSEAIHAATLSAMSQGALMGAPFGQIMSKIPASLREGFIQTVLQHSAILGSFSALSKFSDNFIAQHTYNPKQSLTEGVAEAGTQGAIAGALIPAGGALVKGAGDTLAAGRVNRAMPQDTAASVFQNFTHTGEPQPGEAWTHMDEPWTQQMTPRLPAPEGAQPEPQAAPGVPPSQPQTAPPVSPTGQPQTVEAAILEEEAEGHPQAAPPVPAQAPQAPNGSLALPAPEPAPTPRTPTPRENTAQTPPVIAMPGPQQPTAAEQPVSPAEAGKEREEKTEPAAGEQHELLERPAKKTSTPYETPPKPPMRLNEWLRRPTVQNAGTVHETTIPGGIKDEGGYLKAILGGSKGRPGLINNKSGRSWDDAAHAAWEAGYLPGVDRPDVNALKDAMARDNSGTPVYSEQDLDRVQAHHDAMARNDEIDRLASEHGIPTQGISRDEFFDRLADHLSVEDQGRVLAEQDAAEREAYAAAEKAAKQWIAYHGTPHTFDEFDLAHIGKGEGAQAYGHGFYFAENKGVAEQYRDQLTARSPTQEWYEVDGRRIRKKWSDSSPEAIAAHMMYLGDNDKPKVIEDTKRIIEGAKEKATETGDDSYVRDWQNTLREIEGFQGPVTLAKDQPGHVLQVRLHAKPEEMLDWDKPLSEQSPKVEQALARTEWYPYAKEQLERRSLDNPTGGDLHHWLLEDFNPAEASQMLREAGIKGIRYLDQGSRAEGEGTRNVVMFDPRDIEITHRNGKPVAPEAWNAQHFYDQSQGRTLEDLEREYQQEMAATAAREREAGSEQPGPPGEHQGNVPEGKGAPGGNPGAPGRGEAEGQAKDLLGRPVAQTKASHSGEPTIRNDTRQVTMPGMEGSAIQAQAARDAEGRGALQSDVAQKPADEGLFAPDMSGQGKLYSFPGMLFDPQLWSAVTGPLREWLNRPQSENELMRDKGAIGKFTLGVKAIFGPTSIRGATNMEHALRLFNGETAAAIDRAYHDLKTVSGAIDSAPRDAQIQFTHMMETGQPLPKELQPIADELRSQLDFWKGKVQSLGKGYLRNAFDNYMGHIWVNYPEWAKANGMLEPHPDDEGADEAAARRKARGKAGSKNPLWGSRAFLKQRTFETQLDGIEKGLVPATYNPVDLQLMKIREMQRLYYAHTLYKRLKDTGIAKWVPAGSEGAARAAGMQKLEDPIFQPRLMGEAVPFGRLEPGNFWAMEPAARLFNNFMSRGALSGTEIGRVLYAPLRNLNNAMNAVQLGLSAFHASFMLMDTATSKMALAIQQATRGQVKASLKNFGEAALFPWAWKDTYQRGMELRRGWYGSNNVQAETSDIVRMLKMGGGRITMPDLYRVGATGSFFNNMEDVNLGNWLGAKTIGREVAQMWKDMGYTKQQNLTPFQKTNAQVLRAVEMPFKIIGRTLNTVMQPLMGHLVPIMKLGVFHDLAQDFMDRNPDASQSDMAQAATQFVDSVDNRLGELNYDNLFWHRTLKDIAFLLTRSVGWRLGTIRELAGGAGVDTAQWARDMLAGKKPEVTTRMAYSMALPIMSMFTGALLTWAFTGQGPQSWVDYFFPPTGGRNENGTPERMTMPGYMKDVIGATRDPFQFLANGSSPVLSELDQIFSNKDFYGQEIYNPRFDSVFQAYTNYEANEWMPFSLRAMLREQHTGGSNAAQIMSWFGFQPAPAWVTGSAKEERWRQRNDVRSFKGRNKEPGRVEVWPH